MFAAILLLSVAALLFIRRQSEMQPSGAVRISADGTLLGEYPLSEDRDIPIGNTNVCRIEDGRAYMLEASCPDGLCMRDFSPIGPDGGMIICLPNKVVLEGIPAVSSPSSKERTEKEPQGVSETENSLVIDAVSG